MRTHLLVLVALVPMLASCRSRCCPTFDEAPLAHIALEADTDPGAEGDKAARSLLAEADQVFRSRKYADSRTKYEAAFAAGEAAGDQRVVVEALAQIARTWSIEKALDKGRPFLDRARKQGDPDEPWGWTRYLGVRGIFEREDGDKAKAQATFIEMYDHAMKHELHRRAIDAAHHVAIVAPKAEQVTWGKKGIAAAEALDDRGWQAVLWNNLGVTYEDLKQYDDAVAAYRKARVFHHQGENELPKMIADWAVGHALRLKGDLDDAQVWLGTTLAWARELYAKEPKQAAEWVGYCLEELGDIALARGTKPDALEYFTKARAKYVEGGLDTHWPERLAKLDAKIAALQ